MHFGAEGWPAPHACPLLQGDLSQASNTISSLRRAQSPIGPVMSAPPVPDEADSWAAPATVASLLPQIVMKWDELNIPLVHRSRFYQAFRGK